jgi:uncharacterized membrane protein
MEQVERFIEIECPRNSVFEQWMKFDQYPQFMPGVAEVRRVDHTRLRWRTSSETNAEWDTAITALDPWRAIGWQCVSGFTMSGLARFESITGTRTRLTLTFSYEPSEWLVATVSGAVADQAHRALEQFKRLLETQHCNDGHADYDGPGGEF